MRVGCWLGLGGYNGSALAELERKRMAFAVATYLGSGRDFSRLIVREFEVIGPKPWPTDKPG
jgi:hypothetical protein